jgi:hypothetical protein
MLGAMVNVSHFYFESTQMPGREVINRSENDEENETENPHEDRHKQVNAAYNSDLRISEDEHWNTDESADKPHQHIHRGHNLAGLQNRDANYMLAHRWVFSVVVGV